MLHKKPQKIRTHPRLPQALSFCKWFVIPDKCYITMKQKLGASACNFFRRKDIKKNCYYSTILNACERKHFWELLETWGSGTDQNLHEC